MGEFETVAIDDTPTRLYLAGASKPGSAGVVIFHPWWGPNDDVDAYADRLAAAGFVVAAPDLFGGQVASTIEDAERLMRAADEAAIDAIALSTIDRLSGRLGLTAKSLPWDSRSARTGRCGALPSAVGSRRRSCTTARRRVRS